MAQMVPAPSTSYDVVVRFSSVPCAPSAVVIVCVTLVPVAPYFEGTVQLASRAALVAIVSVSIEGAVCDEGIQLGTVDFAVRLLAPL